MAFDDTFNKLKAGFNKGVTTVSAKTSSAMEKAKLKTRIDALQKEIQAYKGLAGDKAYAAWSASGTLSAELLADEFSAIQTRLAEIGELNHQCDEIDAREKATIAAQEAASQAAAAQAAAAKAARQAAMQAQVAQAQAAVSGEQYVCPNCHTIYTTPVKFCRNCGQKMSE